MVTGYAKTQAAVAGHARGAGQGTATKPTNLRARPKSTEISVNVVARQRLTFTDARGSLAATGRVQVDREAPASQEAQERRKNSLKYRDGPLPCQASRPSRAASPVAASKALRTSGRLMVTFATPSAVPQLATSL